MKHSIETCPDCGVAGGELHDLFCLKERCPFCEGQLASCDCIRTMLRLSDEEKRALDEYVDDSVPPLSDIMRRWKETLDAEGRVPFEPFPDDPIRAAYRSDVDALQRFLDDGYDLHAPNGVGYTALMGAVRGEQVEVVEFLLSHQGFKPLPDERGYTVLHWAVGQPANDSIRQVACVRAVLAAGVDSNARSDSGLTPLMNAAWFGCSGAAKELLRAGADPSGRDMKGRTAVELADSRGHAEVARIIERGGGSDSSGILAKLRALWRK